jgi:hypothetical protein
MYRWDIINNFIKKNNYKRYLEIGYGTGLTFSKILLSDKTSVDRGDGVNDGDSACKYLMPSSEFFSMARDEGLEKYDIIFIDGSHYSPDVIQDIEDSLTVLAEGGTIVMHDCNPEKEEYQIVPDPKSGKWNGDVWKAFFEFRMNRNDLNMYVVDTDEGCGVIQRGTQDLYPIEEGILIDYNFFDKNRKHILNLISVEDFQK